MVTPRRQETLQGPVVRGDIPGPRSAELLAEQDRRESNARLYPRRFPIAIAEAAGSFVRDLDGDVFVDFLNGAGVLPLGHNHPELVQAVTEQLGLRTHGLDFPTRLLPPLNVTAEVVDTACVILPDAFRECCPSAGSPQSGLPPLLQSVR